MAETIPVAPPREMRPRQHQRRQERVFQKRQLNEIIGLAVARQGGPDAFERILGGTAPVAAHGTMTSQIFPGVKNREPYVVSTMPLAQ